MLFPDRLSKEEDIELDNSNYKHGLSIRTVAGSTRTPIDNYRLTLSQETWTGQCIHTSPIQFLIDSSATCGMTMSEEVCLANSPLSASRYVQATDANTVSCLHPLLLLSDHNSGKIVKVTVNYFCIPLDSDLLAVYMKQQEPQQPLSSYVKYLFGQYELPMYNNLVDCGFDNITGGFVCGNGTLGNTTSSDPVLPPRCPWDNGFINPLTPVYDAQLKVCRDAVVDVRYEFTWIGTEIVHLNATVILADVPVFPMKPPGPIPYKMNQMFDVKFVHQGHNVTAGPKLERSGNPGTFHINVICLLRL